MGESVVERRDRVHQAAASGAAGIAILERALNDESVLVRRAAIRGLADIGAPAEKVLAAALDNDDLVVRRTALAALVGEPTPAGVPYLAKGLADKDVFVREMAVRLLVAVNPLTDRIIELLRHAERDESPEVQLVAITTLSALAPSAGVFHPPPRDVVPLRQRADMADHISRIVAAMTIALPRDGWRFRIDPSREGHVQKWFEPNYDDSHWTEMSIETPWMAGYIGVGWYRIELELPERPVHLAAELVFEGVDESAWVWVNGVYVGGQDIGPDGWNVSFRVEVTEELRWNARNQITVRAMNTAFAGGIWKPVRLEALKLK